ncbi:MAG TPA: class I SAM-dependent methyltransferase [Solirubrobacterales bacterium]|nr:class I SAM-dependent methyltransferase [Solirubrobacterales bacterium]
MGDGQTPPERREHFEIERELAARLRNAPSKQERRRLYGQVYRERSERIESHPLVRQAADPPARAEAVRPQAALLRRFVDGETRFCEVGAGDGAVALELAPLVRGSLALDVTDALALPDDEGLGFRFRVFDGVDIGLPEASVDVAYSHDVVEHLHPEDFADHARSIRRCLRPGGVYVCVTPNRLSGPHDVSAHFSDVPQGFHLREYTVTELAAALSAAGFRRVRAVLSARGRVLGPLLPAGLLAPVEAVLGALPGPLRRRLARALAAVKVVAEK